MAEEIARDHILGVCARGPCESGRERERRRRREALPAAGPRAGARPVGQRKHEATHHGGVLLRRRGEGLRDNDPETVPVTAVDADLAQPGIGELAAKSPAYQPRHGRVVGRAGYPDPQRSRGAIAGAQLRLVEGLAPCEQTSDLIELAALCERRVAGAREAAVRGPRVVDGRDSVGERRGRTEQ